MTTTPKNALDRAWGQDASAKKEVRQVCDRTVAKKVRDAFRDSALKNLTDAERSSIVIDGQTCEQELRAAKALEAAQPGTFTFGKAYYKGLVEKYQSKESVESKLKFSRKNPPSPQFEQAFMQSFSHTPKRHLMREWMVMQKKQPQLSDCRGIFIWIWRQHPEHGGEVFDLCVQALHFIVRHKIDELLPDTFAIIRPQVDKILVAAFAATKYTSISPTEWLESHKSIVNLILPSTALAKVLALNADDDMNVAADAVVELVKSSDLGQMIFGSACKTIAAERVEEVVKAAVENLKKMKACNEEDVLTLLRSTQEKIQSIDGIDYLPEKREVQIQYHDIVFTMSVKSTMEQVTLALRSSLRAMAVMQGLLPPLPGEEEIFSPASKYKTECKVAADAILKANSVRVHLKNIVASQPVAPEGEEIQALMTLHGKKLNKLDPYFNIDHCLVAHLTGPEGGNFLKNRFLQECLPVPGAILEVDEALRNASAILKSPIFSWAAASVQAELRAAEASIRCIHLGHVLPQHGTTTDFATTVHSKLLLFVVEELEEAAKSEDDSVIMATDEGGSVYLQGEPALMKKWEAVTEASDVTMEGLNIFVTFRRVLAESEQKKLDEMIAKLLQSASHKRKATAAGQRGNSPAAAAKRGKTGEDAQSRLQALSDSMLYDD